MAEVRAILDGFYVLVLWSEVPVPEAILPCKQLPPCTVRPVKCLLMHLMIDAGASPACVD
jgi:hypothetical protein